MGKKYTSLFGYSVYVYVNFVANFIHFFFNSTREIIGGTFFFSILLSFSDHFHLYNTVFAFVFVYVCVCFFFSFEKNLFTLFYILFICSFCCRFFFVLCCVCVSFCLSIHIISCDIFYFFANDSTLTTKTTHQNDSKTLLINH